MSLAGRAFPLLRPLLHSLDAETAHGLTIRLLQGFAPGTPRSSDRSLAVAAFGLAFPNPLGLAAGFDKNAEVPDAMLGLGFGFVEIGTVTPRPQAGNPRPRLFRLPADRGVINRMGFNNEGQAATLRRLEARAGRPGIRGREHRRQQGLCRPRRRLCGGDRGLLAPGVLCDDQHLLAQHAGLARPAVARRTGNAPVPSGRGAGAAEAAAADASQDRARSRR